MTSFELSYEGSIENVEQTEVGWLLRVRVVPWCIAHREQHFCGQAKGGVHYFSVPWKPEGDQFKRWAERETTPSSVYKVQVLKDGKVVQEAVLPITKKP